MSIGYIPIALYYPTLGHWGPLSLKLLGEVGARNNVRSSFSQWALSETKIYTRVFDPSVLATELSPLIRH